MKRRSLFFSLLAVLAWAQAVNAQNGPGEKPASATPSADAAKAAFEKLKGLAGRWQSKSTIGWEAGDDVRVIGRGSAVIFSSEFKDVPGEGMVTLYFLDRGRLKLTHYCEAGNQPTLVATEILPEGITFEFESGTGMASRDTGHMDKVVMRFRTSDHFTEQWSWYQNGKQRVFEEVEYRRAAAR